jgi:hypothetical protein
MKHQRGQIILVVAVLLMVFLLMMAVMVDGARIYIEQQEIERALDAAGKAGLIIVGNQMVTQVVEAQTLSASIKSSPIPIDTPPGPKLTVTPMPDDFFSWLSEEDRQTLVAPPMQTVVATHVLGNLVENGLDLSNPNVIDIKISFPDDYDPDNQTLDIQLELKHRVVIIFGGVLNLNEGTIYGSSRQTVPQH